MKPSRIVFPSPIAHRPSRDLTLALLVGLLLASSPAAQAVNFVGALAAN